MKSTFRTHCAKSIHPSEAFEHQNKAVKGQEDIQDMLLVHGESDSSFVLLNFL